MRHSKYSSPVRRIGRGTKAEMETKVHSYLNSQHEEDEGNNYVLQLLDYFDHEGPTVRIGAYLLRYYALEALAQTCRICTQGGLFLLIL